ncbi:MAG: hypothetical protein K2X03_13275 [Bryobacteraceae bacterium]|nr:hypothetical protein [Bryobacteraceae bacterium]
MRILLVLAILTASAKDKEVLPPKSGVKTPGVQIPFASLKSEAEVPLGGPVGLGLFTDSAIFPQDGKLVRVDPKTNKLSEPFSGLDKTCGGLVSAFGSLWAPNCGNQTVVRLDPKTGKTAATVSVTTANVASAIAATADSIWLLTDERTTLSRVDPDTNAVVAEVRLEPGCSALHFAETALWLACPSLNKVIRVDPRTNLAVNRIDVAGKPAALTAGEGSIWVLCQAEGKVVRIDPKSNKIVTTVELSIPNADGNIAFGEGSVWVSAPGFPITRIHPGTADKPGSERVMQQFYGEAAGILQVGLKSVWLMDRKAGKLTRFDPKRIAATLAD